MRRFYRQACLGGIDLATDMGGVSQTYGVGGRPWHGLAELGVFGDDCRGVEPSYF